MTTALDIITDALQMIGAYDSASPLTDADTELGLRMLNNMMDLWSNFSLAAYAITEQSGLLVVGQNQYTIGAGGNFNMTRPLKILEGPGAAYVQDTNGNNYDMEVVPRAKWNLYANRTNLVNSNFPNVLFYDPQFPLGVINVLPFPNQPYTMFWDSTLQFGNFANVAVVLSLPPGYEIAMKSNLACILHPFFLDAQLSPNVLILASTSLGAIKRTNARDNPALFDSEIVARGNVSYNVYTDSPGSVAAGLQ